MANREFIDLGQQGRRFKINVNSGSGWKMEAFPSRRKYEKRLYGLQKGEYVEGYRSKKKLEQRFEGGLGEKIEDMEKKKKGELREYVYDMLKEGEREKEDEKVKKKVIKDSKRKEEKIFGGFGEEQRFLLSLGSWRIKRDTAVRAAARTEWAYRGLRNKERLLRAKIDSGFRMMGNFVSGRAEKWADQLSKEEFEQLRIQQTAYIDISNKVVRMEVENNRADLTRWKRILDAFKYPIGIAVRYRRYLIHKRGLVEKKIRDIEIKRDVELDQLRQERREKEETERIARKRYREMTA